MTDYLLKNLFVIQYSTSERGKKVNGRRLSTFMYVEEGQYRYSSQTVDFVINAGDAVYVPEGAVYEYIIESEKTKVIQVEFSFEKNNGDRIKTFYRDPTPLKKEDIELKPIFLEMLSNYYKNEYISISAVYKLISALSERPSKGRIEPAIRYIENNYTEKVYISYLASLCGMSESHLRRLFAEKIGMSPIEYKNSLITKAACNMLLSDKHNVSETAEALGFGDIYTFSQFFKKEIGVSPKRFAMTKS